VVAAAGELPFWPRLDSRARFVDASTQDADYVTLDFGVVGDDAEVFIGRELSYLELGLADYAPLTKSTHASAEAVSCPQCAASIALRASDTKRVVRASCGWLCDVAEGKLQLLAALQRRSAPTLPLGARGTLFAEALEVIGWVRRACTYEGTTYKWSEYLLHGEAGYRWLSESNGHWAFLKPIAAAAVKRESSNNTIRLSKLERAAVFDRVRDRGLRADLRALRRCARQLCIGRLDHAVFYGDRYISIRAGTGGVAEPVHHSARGREVRRRRAGGGSDRRHVSAAAVFRVGRLSYFRAALYADVGLIGTLVGLEVPLLMRLLSHDLELKELVARVLSVDYLGALVASLAFPMFWCRASASRARAYCLD